MSHTSSGAGKIVVITGMHRSGTSLSANLLRHAGLYLGDMILEPDGGNPHGYFEDREILEFHNRLLDLTGESYLVKDRTVVSTPSEQSYAEAAKMVSSRRRQSFWGFKDPRACLFLDLWEQVAPDARFVIVYRHPLEVTLSLLRRGRDCDLEVLADPVAGLRSWQAHNEAVLDFYEQHRDRAHLANIWRVAADVKAWVDGLASKLDLPLKGADATKGFSIDSLHRLEIPKGVERRFASMAPDAAELYLRLETEADCPLEKRSRRKRATRPSRNGPRESLGEAFPVLLAELDPETMCSSKRSLDRLRTTTIASLWSRLSELERRVTEADDRLLRERSHREETARLAHETEMHRDDLARHAAALERRRDEMKGELDEGRSREEVLTRRVAALEGQLEERKASLSRLKNAEIRRLEELTSLTIAVEKSRWTLENQQQILDEQSTRVADLDATLSARENELARTEESVRELQRTLEETEQRLVSSTAEATRFERALVEQQEKFERDEELHARLRNELARDNGTLRAEVRGKDDQVRAVQAHLAVLEKLLADEGAKTMRAELRLASIESTRAWRLVSKWHAMRRYLAGLRSRVFHARAESLAPAEAERTPDPLEEEATPGDDPASREDEVGPSKVLFVSHDAKRHGAQILLLHLLRWLKANADLPFEVLLKAGGELEPEFAALAPVTLWDGSSVVKDLSNPLNSHVGEGSGGESTARPNGESRGAFLTDDRIDLVYSNTATNGSVLEALAGLKCPVLCHVHELEYCLSHQTEDSNLDLHERYADHYIAASQAVKENLTRTLRVPEERLDVVQEFIPTDVSVDPVVTAAIRDRLGIREDALVVGASGTTDWRKGPDLFVQLAHEIMRKKLELPVHFVWVGGEQGGPAFAALWHDVERAGLDARMIFTGSVENPLDYYSTFDVFTLISREDPFPLVNLEVAALAKPIVCFDASGGAKEFVEDDCGFVVPYLDIDAMAERVVELLESPTLRGSFGERAREKVRERNDVTTQAPRILSIIERVAKSGAVHRIR